MSIASTEPGVQIYDGRGIGTGTSKKAAEQAAAREALEHVIAASGAR